MIINVLLGICVLLFYEVQKVLGRRDPFDCGGFAAFFVPENCNNFNKMPSIRRFGGI